MRLLIIYILIGSSLPAFAQFKGGDDDGTNVVIASSQNLGESIFTGGNEDGNTIIYSAAQNLGESVFTGGNNDGNDAVLSIAQSLGESVFTGGGNDGNDVKNSSAQSLGESVFTGGGNDGNDSKISTAQNLGESVFTGGGNDGNDSKVSSAQSLGESVFAGGGNDGNDSKLSSAQSMGEAIYTGGQNDGFNFAVANSVSLAESIFKGGSGEGFIMAFVANRPLPVKLLTFNAVWKGNDAQINWETNNAYNMDGYILERSFDSKTFDSLYYTSCSNSYSRVDYSYTDEKLAEIYNNQHVYYFRLKQLESNGKSEYSAIATLIKNDKKNFTMTVFPNPVSDELHLNISGNDINNLEIQVLATDGKLVKKISGVQQNIIKISELAAGNYTLNVLQNNETVFTQRIIVVK